MCLNLDANKHQQKWMPWLPCCQLNAPFYLVRAIISSMIRLFKNEWLMTNNNPFLVLTYEIFSPVWGLDRLPATTLNNLFSFVENILRLNTFYLFLGFTKALISLVQKNGNFSSCNSPRPVSKLRSCSST